MIRATSHEPRTYIGRFAPAPTGPLHFGSIIAALGSFLQARSQGGQWLIRIEDIDTLRIQPGAQDSILHTLDKLALHWDGEIIIQSQREFAYEETLVRLEQLELLYPCACTRKETKGKAYPGTCRMGIAMNKIANSTRIHTNDDPIEFNDLILGKFSQRVGSEIGDFIVRRADKMTAYHLAVVVDDAHQEITEIVRGADLLDSTPRQIYLQGLLGYETPNYCHLPIAANPFGEKISKQNHAPAVDHENLVAVLHEALKFLGQQPEPELLQATTDDIVDWGIKNWDISKVPRQKKLVASC